MILQALHEYYQRKPELPREGWMEKEIDLVAVVDAEGKCHQLKPTMEKVSKKWVSKVYRVPAIGPQALKHSMAGDDPNLLWDNASFVFGLGKNGKRKAWHFRRLLRTASRNRCDDPAIYGVRRFLTAIARYPDRLRTLLNAPELQLPEVQKALDNRGTVTFRFSDDTDLLVCHRLNVERLVGLQAEADEQPGICLITGDQDIVARLNNSIEGVRDKPGAPARKYLVAFQKARGFDSYGKEQGGNAPVGKRAAFAYTTALNHLLASKQRVQIGDTSTVFWAAKENRLESLLSQLLEEPPLDNPDQGTSAVQALFEAPKAGAPAIYDDGTRFHVLGLAPNAARAAVRFWQVATVGELAGHIRQHFTDLEIVRPRYVETPFLSVKALLLAVSPLGDLEKLPPNLAGDLMQAILAGAPYPQTLLHAALRRIRAEQARKDDRTGKPKNHVSYARAALVKAWLNRTFRKASSDQKGEIGMALDEGNTMIGYRLGRLFAVLEKVQEEANPRLNTTIRDSYFGSASSTPGAVFSTLMRRNQHHMTKLRKEKPGLYVVRDKLIQSVFDDGLEGRMRLGFPPVLPLTDQGLFVIGYYQQRQALFT